MRTILLTTLRPLGLLLYGLRLQYEQAVMRNIQCKNPTHPDLLEAMGNVYKLHELLAHKGGLR